MPTTATPVLLTDPGYIFTAPLGTAEPTNTVVGSVFTDAWPAGWVSAGATEEGGKFAYEIETEQITAAEFFDPLKIVTVGRSGSFAFAMMSWTLTNLKVAMNGGTLTLVSGTGATALNKFEPPDPGTEVRRMIGWESLDATARLVCRQTLQAGSIEPSFAKAPEKALIACEFQLEVPAAAKPFAFWTAGASRA